MWTQLHPDGEGDRSESELELAAFSGSERHSVTSTECFEASARCCTIIAAPSTLSDLGR